MYSDTRDQPPEIFCKSLHWPFQFMISKMCEKADGDFALLYYDDAVVHCYMICVVITVAVQQ